MTDLIVDRLHARAAVADPDDGVRVRGLLADLTTRRLDEVLSASSVPTGDWYLRRLEVSLDLDPTRPDVAITRDWARAVTVALCTALADAGPDVVRFRGRLDAIADLVATLALARPGREWAWRAAGVLTDADPDPVSRPAETVIAILARDPGRAVHALSLAVTRAGLPAVHRLLGTSGWRQVASVVLAASGQRATDWLGDTGTAAPDPAAAHRVRLLVRDIAARSPLAGAWRRSRLRPDPEVQRAWAVLAAAEAEPAMLRRPGAATVLAMLPSVVDGAGSGAAIPAPAAARPNVTSPGDGPGRHGYGVDGRKAAPPVHGTGPARDEATSPGDGPGRRGDAGDGRSAAWPAHGTGPARHRQRDETQAAAIEPRATSIWEPSGHPPAAPERPSSAAAARGPRPGLARASGATAPGGQAETPAWTAADPGPDPALASDGTPTRRGGLVYLFATADAAGIPDAAFADDALGEQPASWLLFQLAQILAGSDPAAREDPAVRAVAGLPPHTAAPGPEPTAEQRVRLGILADAWARATADAMGSDEDPRALVARICARAGVVVHDPGWIEFRLRLADVDVDVRRAGLDLDPGFVSWLGAVVVIRYE
jgi:hypothetical protein